MKSDIEWEGQEMESWYLVNEILKIMLVSGLLSKKMKSLCSRWDMASELVDFRIASLIIDVHREFSKSVIERGGQGKEVM